MIKFVIVMLIISLISNVFLLVNIIKKSKKQKEFDGVLKIDSIDPESDFFSLGLSISVNELVNRDTVTFLVDSITKYPS